jgi:cell filamentation protein
MSKYRLSHSSIYVEGSNVPKNKFGITSSNIIAEVEKLHLEQSYNEFSSKLNSKIVLDESYFVNLHKKTFESLYDFAGVYRDVNMTKGDSQFCLAQYLYSESSRIFKELESDNYLADCRDDKALFAQKLAYYQGELIALHPFYEINGRITRFYCDMLALFNGYKPIDYSKSIDNGAYIEASIECVQYADSSRLNRIVFEGLSR